MLSRKLLLFHHYPRWLLQHRAGAAAQVWKLRAQLGHSATLGRGLIFMTFAISKSSSDFPCLCFAKWFKSKPSRIKISFLAPLLTNTSIFDRLKSAWEGVFISNNPPPPGSRRVTNRDQWNRLPSAEPGEAYLSVSILDPTAKLYMNCQFWICTDAALSN